MAKIYVETPWDLAPDSTSKYEIYNPDDQYILGNAVEPIQKYDGVSFVDLDGGAPKGNIFAVYKDRLIVAGDTNHPHRLWFSHVRNGEGWSTATDWLDVRPDDGGKINGLQVQGDELIISKSNEKIYGWQIYDGNDPANSRIRLIEDDKGLVSNQASTVLDDVMYYLARERVDTIPAEIPAGLSNIVEEVVKGVASFANRAVGSNDGKVYVALGDITVSIGDDVELSNAVLVYDTSVAAFYIRDNIDARVFAKFIESEQENLYFGDTSGRVYKIGEGNLAGEDPIHMRVRTKPFLRELGSNISFKRLGVYMDDPDGTVVSVRTNLDSKKTTMIGSVRESPVQWFDLKDITGPLLQVEFTHSNENARPRLLGIDIDYDEQGRKE